MPIELELIGKRKVFIQNECFYIKDQGKENDH